MIHNTNHHAIPLDSYLLGLIDCLCEYEANRLLLHMIHNMNRHVIPLDSYLL